RPTSPLAKPAPAPGVPNDFGVCVKEPHILIQNILVKDPITMTRAEALNLAAWIVALSGINPAKFVKTVLEIKEPGVKPTLSSPGAHQLRHIYTHEALDELVADWVNHT